MSKRTSNKTAAKALGAGLLTLRVSAEERAMISKGAKRAGLTVTDYLKTLVGDDLARRGVRGARTVEARLARIEQAVLRAEYGVGLER